MTLYGLKQSPRTLIGRFMKTTVSFKYK